MLNEIKEVTFEITNRCNLQCKICNIWREKKTKDISFKEIKKILESFRQPLTVSLTGGEPLLHPDFERIYRYIYKLFLQKKVKNLDISTNAYSQGIIDFLSRNKSYLQPLTLSISLDGLEKNHNRQRGKKDAFAKTLNNIIKITRYHLAPTIKFVITDLNYQSLAKTYKLSKSLGLPFNCKPAERINSYYHRYGNSGLTLLSSKNFPFIRKIISDIRREQKGKNKSLEYLSLSCIEKFLTSEGLNFVKRCATPEKSLFITSSAEIYACIYQDRIGTIRQWPKIYEKNRNDIISRARKGNCPKCLSYHGYIKRFNF